jgi:LPS-assembly protein
LPGAHAVFSTRQAGLVLAVAGLLPYQHSAAQGLCFPAEPSLPTSSESPAPPNDEIEIRFGQMALRGVDNAEFSENVEIRQQNKRFTTERALYDRTESTFDFEGRVTYSDGELTVFGEDAHFDSNAGEVNFGNAGFEMPLRPARGSASSIEISDATDTVSLRDMIFTTCPIEQMAWQIVANDVEFKAADGVGTARGMRLKFRGMPILYAPYFTFPLNDERKSGFLTPDFSDRDRTGLYIAVPYYFNLAPNFDLTLEPRYLSKRGVQISNQFRYLMPRSIGQLNYEFLPDDSAADRSRSYLNLQHKTGFGSHWELNAGIEEVSDSAYFDDLGTSLSVTSQTHLNRFVDLGYYASRWSLMSRFQNYQTIDPLIVDADQPYERVPQFLFEGNWGQQIVHFDAETELVNFDRDIGTTGWRFDSTQELSLQFARSGMYLTPALAWRQTNYWLDEPAPGTEQELSRGLPIASLDMGMTLERSLRKRPNFTQTLEPRMLYVSVPFEDQSALPVFDTIMPDFNLIQLFRKYQYVGPDRINDTDQLSIGVTTRLVDSRSGQRLLIATLGQTRYLKPQRVTLPDETPSDARQSDYVAELSVNMKRAWSVDLGYQWNSETSSTARAETRFEYRPQEDRLFGFGYRFRRDTLEQGDVSMVWPVTQRWRIIGRYSYSLLEKAPLEQFLGWEYDACCWRLRVVGRQYVSRRTGETDSAISLQLELKGLSNGAVAPEELLDRGILGYQGTLGNTRL